MACWCDKKKWEKTAARINSSSYEQPSRMHHICRLFLDNALGHVRHAVFCVSDVHEATSKVPFSMATGGAELTKFHFSMATG